MSEKSIVEATFSVDNVRSAANYALARESIVGHCSDEELNDALGAGLAKLITDITQGQIRIPITKEASELDTVSESLVEIFLNDVDEVAEHCNPLTSWTTYQSLIDSYGYKADGGRALMIGALSPLSSRAFEVLASDVLGADSAYVTDIWGGKYKRQFANFVLGSGLDLPYASDSMDFVVTNKLLHMLTDPTEPSIEPEGLSGRLSREIVRVLKPGGQLLMKESEYREYGSSESSQLWVPSSSASDLGAHLVSVFESVGLDRTTVDTKVYEPKTVEFMFDPSRNFDKYEVEQIVGGVALYGRKPE